MIAYYIKHAPVSSFFFLAILVTFFMQMSRPEVTEKFAFNPYRVHRNKEYYRFFTSMLVHGSTMHLFFNMFTYYFFAFPLEIQYFGSIKFFIIMIFSQIASQFYDFFKWKNNPSFLSVGASGAISGLIFAFIAFNPTATLLFFFFPIPAWLFGILFLAYSAYAGRDYAGGINHYAHLIGALAGLGLTLVFYPHILKYWLALL